MDKKHIIVSETPRPFWQLIIAALFLTFAVFVITLFIYRFNLDNKYLRSLARNGLPIIGFLIAGGLSFCTQKRIYIDLENSKFKPSLEVGFVKIGKWKTINNYEYVSIFFDPSKSETEMFEVNLWYDRNKHFELYTRNNFEDAVSVGFDISKALNIDLLDATIPNDFKWIDKDELKQN
ncbi:hypothetical protein [Lacinutrix sp.]|uniref:hypothetical protein n=1 Tax=Lacinutrix sp. TaxID=1937692 RepID=UPI0025B9AE31|nr:hypothetical protein [Lacinutrix sp.]